MSASSILTNNIIQDFSNLPYANSLRIRKMMKIFISRSVRIQVQNNCKKSRFLRLDFVERFVISKTCSLYFFLLGVRLAICMDIGVGRGGGGGMGASPPPQ